ncbi:gag/pol protein [Cucumis melo var. makuwa]|uniref:Gag/pol protein n=1 Tax=Cucumis melo var. makuwa TaxID=1194695 RepID=A0A5A7TT32_CUCMM|nr:gag/pol protein [Cucumis melo var. makuwa]
MSSLIIALLKKDQLTGKNYATWKSKLNMILVIADLCFVLMEECHPFPTKYASQSVRDAYDCWTKANDKARLYILASMSNILIKKHEIMVTARQIMDSLREMFGQPSIQIKQEANVPHSRRFAPLSSGSKKIQKRKGVVAEGKRNAKVAIKEKCFHCNDDEHWNTNCPKYLVKKKEKEGATNHVCSSLQETSSFKQLEESEMTLKVETGDVISARAVGDAKSYKSRSDQKIGKNGLLNELEDDSLPPCESCLKGKMTKRHFTEKGYRAKEPLELIHSDLCGPMNVKVRGGLEYFISFIDDYSRYGYLYLMEHKFEALEKFKEYKAEVEHLLSIKIKILRSDRGGKYMNLRFQDYMIEHGIQSQLSAPGTPQQNGVSERRNRTLLDMVRSMMSYAQLPSSFLGYTVEIAVHILNNVLSKSVVIPDDGVEDPLSYKQAMNDVDKDQWVKAMDLEMESMYFNSVWELVDLPEGVKPIGCKWIYKRKRDSAGKSIRILLSIATFYDYEIWQMDVKTAFLNDNLEVSIFMSQPKGFITQGQEQKVCKLNLSIYGLKQASRSWNIRFDTAIKSYGFDQNVNEPCVYKKINKEKVAFLVLYVDDILLIGNDVGYLTDVKAWLAAQFQMKDLEEAQYAGVHLSKEQCSKTPQEVEDMRRIPYASAVGSLMYVMLYTRPDICYAVGIVSRYQSNPGLDHWTANSKKSTSGSVFTLNGGAVVWRSIKQGCIVDSTMEAEYVAAYEAAKEAIWLRKFLHDLEVVPNMNLRITLYCDNSGVVTSSKEPRSHKQGKHIERKYHLIREIVQRGDVIVTKIASEHNIADPFTKTLTAKVFVGHLESLGLRDMYIR